MTYTIYPYFEPSYYQSWVFDDTQMGFKGIDRMIDLMTVNIPNARSGVKLIFSDEPFSGYQVRLDWIREGNDWEKGHWYISDKLDLEGWLCPSLLLYYTVPPKHIYVLIE
jgi:hypothetical protein